jgi:hypothetical protein
MRRRLSNLALFPLKEPKDFNANFVIPPFQTKLLLETNNQHELDQDITMEDVKGSHKYFFKGKEVQISVSQLASMYFNKFDPDWALQKMKEGPNWPRAGYTMKNGNPLPDEYIKKKWEQNGEYARNSGTWMHHNIERYLNGMVRK